MYLKISFFANIDNLLKASDQSAAPASQRSWIQIPYRPEFFFSFRPYFHYCSTSVHYREDRFHILAAILVMPLSLVSLIKGE